MRYFFVIAIFSFLIILSCKNSIEKGNLLNRDNLPSKEYTINIDKDTTLQTQNGALLKIPKGALKTETGNTVTLEIKEAFSLSEMIKAGLVTQSNDEALSSGGMIYINAASGQRVTITQAIKIAMPANYLQRNMKLYKGDTSSGQANWIDPVALPENKQLTSINQGQILFQKNCASCHAIGKDLTGPNLAHFVKRFPYDEKGSQYYTHDIPSQKTINEIEKFLQNGIDTTYQYFGDFSFYNSYHAYKCNLVNMYGSRGPNLNSDSSGNYWFEILRYVQNESDRLKLSLPSHAFLNDCIDSCERYKNEITRLQYKKNKASAKKKELIKQNGSLVHDTSRLAFSTNDINTNMPAINFDQKIAPGNYDAVYYQFTIESFGWYNIDILMKGLDGVKESELFVRIRGEYHEKIKVYLIIPSMKTYLEGGSTGKKDEYAFDKKNGQISLPQNVEAYILSLTETERSIAYSLKEFSISGQQTIEVSLLASTKEEFNSVIENSGFDGFKIRANDAKNANEIRRTDVDLKNIDNRIEDVEKLRPRRCDCDCGYPVK